LIGGVILNEGRSSGRSFDAFALIFLLALGARVLSATCLAIQSERQPAPIGETSLSPEVIRNHIRTGGHGRLLLYLLTFQLSVWIAAPYFTPYMLGPLALSYAEFTVLTAAAFLARVLVLPTLGNIVRRSGTKKMLGYASLGIIPVPALWLVNDSFAWLFLLQLISGAAWGAFELASLLAFFERIPSRGQTSILTVYNLANALAIVVGGAIGGWLLGSSLFGLDSFAVVLVVSVAARGLSLVLLRGIPEVVPKGPMPSMRTLAVRPSSGGVQRPIFTGGTED
jgi:MFS family permease